MDDNFVGAIAVVLIFGGPVFAFVAMRLMAHRERMEMLRNGIVPPVKGWTQAPWGQPGASQPQPQPMPASRPGKPDSWDESPQRTLRKGVVLAAIGVALTLGLGFIGFLVEPGRYTPGPWLLGGLIPLFVGLAQVLIAVISGATLGPPNHGPYGYRMDSAGAQTVGQTAAPPPPPTFDGSYTYRPDPSTQELAPPQRPPDRR